MASCEPKYTTLVDLARQSKIITGNTACVDGKFQAGLPFSGYPTGPDLSTMVSLGVVSSQNAVISGNSITTFFDVANPTAPGYNPIFDPYSGTTWSNPLFQLNVSGLTLPITPLSADTQTVGPVWTLTQTGKTGDHIIGTQYTGYTIQYVFDNLDGSPSSGYTSVTGFTTAIQQNYSAGTLDYKGPVDYLRSREDATVDNRLTTKKLRVTGGASASTIGYVLTQVDELGSAEWVFNSASASTNTFVVSGLLNGSDQLELTYNTGGSVPPIDLSALSGASWDLQNVLDEGTTPTVAPFSSTDSVGILTGGESIVLGTGDPLGGPPTTASTITWFDGVKGTLEMGGFDSSSSSGSNGAVKLNAQNQLGVSHVDVTGGFIDISTTGSTIMLEADGNILIDGLGDLTSPTIGDVLSAKDGSGRLKWVSVSADTNTFVTGGTLNPTNELILNWNTGGSAHPIDLSELKFSGGSGSCITDLYVSNIHPCSPLTIIPNNEGDLFIGSGFTFDLTTNIDQRLGINTNTPAANLHLKGLTPPLSDNLFLIEDSGGNIVFGANDEGALAIGVDPHDLAMSGESSLFIKGDSSTTTGAFDDTNIALRVVNSSNSNILLVKNSNGVNSKGTVTINGNWGALPIGGTASLTLYAAEAGTASTLNVLHMADSNTNTIGSIGADSRFRFATTHEYGMLKIGNSFYDGEDGKVHISPTSHPGGGNIWPTISNNMLRIDGFENTGPPWLSYVSNIFVVDNFGNVSVKKRTTTENFTMTSGATLDYVLTSDGVGNASWEEKHGTSSGSCIDELWVARISGCTGEDLHIGVQFGQDIIFDSHSGSSQPHLYINDKGQIGVGTNSPFSWAPNDGTGIEIHNESATNDQIPLAFTETGTRRFFFETDFANTSNPVHIKGSSGTNLMTFYTSSSSSRVGVGTTVPDGTFQIAKSGAIANQSKYPDETNVVVNNTSNGYSGSTHPYSSAFRFDHGSGEDPGGLITSIRQSTWDSGDKSTTLEIWNASGETLQKRIEIRPEWNTNIYGDIKIVGKYNDGSTSDNLIYTDLTNPILPKLMLSGSSGTLAQIGITNPQGAGLSIGYRGETEPTYDGYGKQGDGFIYSSAAENGLNIISQQGTNKDDYIRFYVGNSTGAAPANTPDIHIQGSGTTRGNVGINTKTPTEKLNVEEGNVLINYEHNGDSKIKIQNKDAGTSARTMLSMVNRGPGGIDIGGLLCFMGSNFISTALPTFQGQYLPNSLNLTSSGGSTASRANINIGSRRGADAETRFFGGSDNFDNGSLLGTFYTSGLTITDMVNTDTLRVRNNATTGYVLTATDNLGNASWQPSSGMTGTTYWEVGSGLKDTLGSHTITSGALTDFSIIAGGESNEITSGFPIATHNAILGGKDNIIHANVQNQRYNSIIGGEFNEIGHPLLSNESNGSAIIGGNTNKILGAADNCVLIGHESFTAHGVSDCVFVPSINIGDFAVGPYPTKFRLDDGTQQAGYVLTSDGSGNADWQPSSGGSFTGNTSGTCIDVLWVSTISGCSPVTIGSSVQSSTATASGIYSMAYGFETVASGEYSHAEGQSTIATGSTAHAEGEDTMAYGENSHAEGKGTLASGEQSHAEGVITQAIGGSSHAEGQVTIALGDASHAEGEGTIASGVTSHSEGYETQAQSDYTHAEGYKNKAIGLASHAEGGYPSKDYWNEAIGEASHAEGHGQVYAIGDGSHAEGINTVARGAYSHTEGAYTEADGLYSHAQGYATRANGDFSHAGGGGLAPPIARNLVASGDTSFIHYGIENPLLPAVDIGAFGDYSAILGGVDHDIDFGSHKSIILGGGEHYITNNAQSSGILGGTNNTIQASNSIILGGSNLTASNPNTVYVPILNIDIVNAAALGAPNVNLSIDNNNNVVSGFSWSDSSVTAGNSSGDCITELWVTDVESCSPLYINRNNQGDIYFGEQGGAPSITMEITTPNEPAIYFGEESFIRWKENEQKLIIGEEEVGGKVVIEVEGDEILDIDKEKTIIKEGDFETEDGNIIVKSGTGKTVIIEDLPDVSAADLGTDLDGKIIDEPSDSRVKENREPLPNVVNVLEFIKNVKGYQFTWSEDSRIGDPNKPHYGFMVDHFRDDLIDPKGQNFSSDHDKCNEIAKSMVRPNRTKFKIAGNPQPQQVDSLSYTEMIPFIVEGLKAVDFKVENLTLGALGVDVFVDKGEYDDVNKTIVLTLNDAPSTQIVIPVEDLVNTNNYVSDATLLSDVLTLEREGLSDLTVNLSSLKYTPEVRKYVETLVIQKNTATTITHNLNDKDIIVQVINELGELIIPDKVYKYELDSIDIEMSVTGTYKIITMK